MTLPAPGPGRTAPRAGAHGAHRSWGPGVAVVALAFLMVPAPALGHLPGAAAPAPASEPPPAAPAPPVLPRASPSSALPGTGPNLPGLGAIDRTQLVRFANESFAASQALARPSGSAVIGGGIVGAVAYLPTGTFTGYVANSSNPADFLSGVTAQAYPEQGGQFCPIYKCAPGSTGSNGQFNITCAVGRSYVTFTKSFWAENLTYATCALNQTVDVGTVYLLPDGVVTGRVLGDIGGHNGIAGVQVQGEARDYTVIASPVVATNSTGGFTVALPPSVAGRIDFTSPGVGFQDNYTFLTVPSGGVVDIGSVYLEPNSLVEAKLYDAVTGAAIDGGFMAPDSLTLCSSVTGVCGNQGPATISGNVVEAEGAPGYDYVFAEAVGYLLNQSPIGYVPGTSPGHPYCVPDNCKIFLTPIGGVRFTVDISGSKSPAYGTGLWTVQVCGLAGYQVALPKFNPVTYTFNTSLTTCLFGGCVGAQTTYIAAGFPLRNDIQISPDTAGVCFPPTPTWPIPGDLPVWGNETWANITPDEVTNAGYLNLTPGSYVQGHVYVAGTTTAPPDGFEVQVQSRISNTLSTYPYLSSSSPDVCPGGGATTFCAPAPPGPDKVTVSAAGFPENTTWLSIPWTCCSTQTGPFSLSQSTLPSIDSLNMTLLPTVNGSLVVQGGTEPVGFGAVTVCSASPTSVAACSEALLDRAGRFSALDAPLGWDLLHGSASGYAPNSQWFYVNSRNVSLPPMPLAPLATLEGLVVSTNGSAIIDASVYYCTLAQGVSSQNCRQPLGSGLTTSEGYYQGLVGGGWLPGATYEVEASAPGYETDWTWVNATVNQTTVVPTLDLVPVGSSTPATGAHGAAVTNPAGTWVVARLVDNSTGAGVSTNSVQGCAVTSGQCTQFLDPSNTGGYLNGSLPVGVYNLTVAAAGYYATVVLLTVPAGVPTVDAGTIALTPLPWVFGRVTLDPWRTVEVTGVGSPVALLLAPPATVLGCALVCGQATPDSTSGTFQVQAYAGHGDTLHVNPSYPGTFTSAPGGFVNNVTTLNVTGPMTNLTVEPSLALFAAVSGNVTNAASCGAVNLTVCPDPARWVSVVVSTSGANNGAATATANGGGDYTTFLPGGNDAGATTVNAGDTTMFFSRSEPVPARLGPGQNLTWTAASIALTQFGYAYASVVDSATGLPAVATGLASTFDDPINGNFGSTTGTTNGAGFVNITAPSGLAVQFTVGGSNDYNSTSFQAPVPVGNATDLDPYFAPLGGPVQIPAWGWVQGGYVNFSAPPGFGGVVVDALNGRALAGAAVSVTSADPNVASGSSAQTTNSLGEFVSDAPIGPADSLVIGLPAYLPNDTHPLNVSAGAHVVVPRVNLTGDGVLASQVLSEPTGTPVAGATVTACEGTGTTSVCAQTITNATGHYWVNVAPGHISITVAATNFVSNYTEFVTVTSDTWQGIPAFHVVEDGLLIGTVRGLPTGLPVGGAVVAACSPLGGTPTGPCSFRVTTLSNGSFHLPVVPSQYILATSAPDFNATYLPVAVQPGETVDLGVILVTEYGVLAGTVLNAATDQPIANATVGGCPVDTLLPCDAPAVTDLGGHYRIASPPGGVYLVVSAVGFVNGYTTASARSGATVTVPTLSLSPLAVESTYHVSGHVVVANAPSQPVAGATVALWVGAAVAASTAADAGGSFSLAVPTGSYSLRVTAPGYVASGENLDVTQPISGLVLTMAPFGWTVSGTVADGLTGATLPGVAIWSPSGIVAVTDPSGAYTASLANGTYLLTAIAGGTSAPLYAPVAFEVDVAAASVVRSVHLYPGGATLDGTVVSATDQSGIVGAHVTVTGTAVDGAALAFTATTDALGHFSIAAYFGSYSVSVAAPGYTSVMLHVSAGATNPAMGIELSPVGASGGASLAPWAYAAVGIALVVALAAAVVLAARHRPKEGDR